MQTFLKSLSYSAFRYSSTFVFFCLALPTFGSPLTPEAVLGDYRADPIFGEAAADTSIIIDVGRLTFAPKNITVQPDSNIRFVMTNSSQQTHLMVISDDLAEVEQDTLFVDNYLQHGTDNTAVSGSHNHANTSTNAQHASPMVKEATDRPTVFLKPGETKEVLVRFDDNSQLAIGCVLDKHYQEGMKGIIDAKPKW